MDKKKLKEELLKHSVLSAIMNNKIIFSMVFLLVTVATVVVLSVFVFDQTLDYTFISSPKKMIPLGLMYIVFLYFNFKTK